MIDLHILTHEGTRQDWLEQAIASTVDQGVTVHLIDNGGRSVGQGRSVGYQQGDHELVAYLDSDDYLLPGAAAVCLEAMRHHRAVVTMEVVEYPDGSRYPFPRLGHALTVYRRSDVLPWVDAMAASAHTTDARLRGLLRPYQLTALGYVWRVHPGGDHNLMTPDAFEQEGAAWLTPTEQQ